MIGTTKSDQRRAFAIWLRTGRISFADHVELKFNPWHDPENGRFTFAEAGRSSERGAGTAPQSPRRAAPRPGGGSPALRTGIASRSRVAPVPTPLPANPANGAAIEPVAHKPAATSPAQPGRQTNTTTEFISGVGQGLYETVAGTASGAYSALTTNPVTTIRNAERGIAQTIDSAIAAEDVPAHVQVSRAASALRIASPHDVGRVTGAVAGSAALAVVPGVAMGRLAALRRLRNAGPPAPPYTPPDIRWVKESLGDESAFKRYNDAAFGARPGQAPAIRRTMPDGSKRPVKFDGLQGDTLIDRKLGVDGRQHAVDQMLRQSQALSENNLRAVWEVSSLKHMNKALKMLKKHNIRNISLRIVEP